MKSVLEHNVLVLNTGWSPVNVTVVRDAIGLLYKEAASIILHEDIFTKFGRPAGFKFQEVGFAGWIEISAELDEAKYPLIHSARHKFLVPSIIILRKYEKAPKYFIKLSKNAIYNRDKGHCQYCNVDVPKYRATVDHIIPKSRGGLSTWNNLVLCCQDCNKTKRDRRLEDTNMHLLKKPVKPSELNFRDIYKEESKKWADFIK